MNERLQTMLVRRWIQLGFSGSHEVAKNMANECIRQMEWARTNCHDLTAMQGGRVVNLFRALTLAPDDWQATQDAPGAPE